MTGTIFTFFMFRFNANLEKRNQSETVFFLGTLTSFYCTVETRWSAPLGIQISDVWVRFLLQGK